MTSARPRVLCVDDEALVLDGLRDCLRRSFDVVTAVGGAAGLAEIEKDPSFAVILSDMRMPGMSGTRFLLLARLAAPDAVRMLLTGHADLDSAVAAVNHGQIFRFLTKPCPQDVLLQGLVAALRQHWLQTSERVLLDKTLQGAVSALVEVLSLADPIGFERATRLKRYAGELARDRGLEGVPELEMAAMLSQLGAVMLPRETAERYEEGGPLSADETALLEAIPGVAVRLLRRIPRLEGIRGILEAHGEALSGAAAHGDRSVRARVLTIAHDFDVLEGQGRSTDDALETMRGRDGRYDAELLEAFARLRGSTSDRVVKELQSHELEPGMVLADDALSEAGGVVVPRGTEISETLLERLRGMPPGHLRGPLRVRVATTPA